MGNWSDLQWECVCCESRGRLRRERGRGANANLATSSDNLGILSLRPRAGVSGDTAPGENYFINSSSATRVNNGRFLIRAIARTLRSEIVPFLANPELADHGAYGNIQVHCA